MPAKKPVKKPTKKPAPSRKKLPSLVDHERRIVTLEGNMPAFGALVEQVRAQLKVVAEGQIMLRDSLRAEMAQFEERISGEVSNLALVVRENADGQLRLERKVEQLEAEVGRLGRAQEATSQEIVRLVEGQKELSGRMASVETRVGAVETRLGAVETRLEAVETRLEGVEGAVREQAERLESGEQRLARLEGGGRG